MFANLFKNLSEEGVDFLVLGGAAVCLSGFGRFTEDIDILISNTPENVERFVTVAARWGEGNGAGLTFEDFQGAGALRIVEDFPLDVFTLVDGRDYEHFAANAVKHVLDDGLVIPTFSIHDLIAVKSKTLRERDAIDVTALKRIQAGAPSDPPQINLDPMPSEEPTLESEVSPPVSLSDVGSGLEEKIQEAQQSLAEQKQNDKNKGKP